MHKFSLLKKLNFRNIVYFMLLLVILDIVKLITFSNHIQHSFTISNILIISSLGIIVIIMAFFIAYPEEKWGIFILGVALIIDRLAYFFNSRIFILVSMGFGIIALYFFYLFFKKQKYTQHT